MNASLNKDDVVISIIANFMVKGFNHIIAVFDKTKLYVVIEFGFVRIEFVEIKLFK